MVCVGCISQVFNTDNISWRCTSWGNAIIDNVPNPVLTMYICIGMCVLVCWGWLWLHGRSPTQFKLWSLQCYWDHCSNNNSGWNWWRVDESPDAKTNYTPIMFIDCTRVVSRCKGVYGQYSLVFFVIVLEKSSFRNI